MTTIPQVENVVARRGRRSGTAAIEFALLAPVVIFGLVGTVELGRVFWIRAALQYAAEETARQAMIIGGGDENALISFGKSRLMALSEDQVTIAVDHDMVDDTEYVTITASHPLTQLANLIPGLPATITGAARTSVLE